MSLRELEDKGVRSFSKKLLGETKSLFEQRSALFFTPTANIPIEFIGSGMLDIDISLSLPNYLDVMEIRSYRSPRLWVDLIQRETNKIRWQPINPAKVTIISYNNQYLRPTDAGICSKAIVDALKESTTGRRNGKRLYYFGAIKDDAPGFIDFTHELKFNKLKRRPYTRLVVKPLK